MKKSNLPMMMPFQVESKMRRIKLTDEELERYSRQVA